MKIEEFSLVERNIADEGEPIKMGEWKDGSGMASLATGIYTDGKKYQLKLRPSPRWNDVDSAIAELKRQLRAASGDAADRLESQIKSLEKSREKKNKADAVSDQFLTIKNETFERIRRGGDCLIASREIWKQPINVLGKNGAVFSVEATPWVDDVQVGISDDAMVNLQRDIPRNEQYRIIGTLARALEKLHAQNVLHGDLKIGNTLVVGNEIGRYSAVIIDFDASIMVDKFHNNEYPFKLLTYIVSGTFYGPEMVKYHDACTGGDVETFEEMNKEDISLKSDIFSLGCTIYEILFGRADNMANRIPFKNAAGDLWDSVSYGEAELAGFKPDCSREPNGAEMDELLKIMLPWMLDADPNRRPTAKQVALAFEAGNFENMPDEVKNAMPPELMPFDASAPWESDNIEITPKAGYSVKRNPRREGMYFVISDDGFRINCNAKRLISDGYAKRIGGGGEEVAPTMDNTAFWPEHAEMVPAGVTKLPKGITRAGKPYYMTKDGGVTKMLTIRDLKEGGYLASEDELSTPWPGDNVGGKFKFKEAYVGKIIRNVKKGVGHYIIKDAFGNMLATKQQLLMNGYASEGVKISPAWNGDNITFNEDNLPADLDSITRDTFYGAGHYVFTFKDGKKKYLNISDMRSSGYIL